MVEDQVVQHTRNHALQEYTMPNPGDNLSSIVRPTMDTNNFEIKPTIIQMVSQFQFEGLPTEDPNAHLARDMRYIQDERGSFGCYQVEAISIFSKGQG